MARSRSSKWTASARHIEFRLPNELQDAVGQDRRAVGRIRGADVVGIPLLQAARIGAYVVRQHLAGRKRYPLVLMLEPLFRCNLACAGCGKIDYPDEILNQRLSYDECMAAIDECGAPVVSIAGGEPLLHRDMPQIVKGYLARKKFVILCTNALLLAKKIDEYKPHPVLHLVDPSRRQPGHARQVGLPARRLRQGGRGDPARQVEGLPRQHQLHAVQRRRSRSGRRLLRRDEGARARRHHRLARLCL